MCFMAYELSASWKVQELQHCEKPLKTIPKFHTFLMGISGLFL